MTQIKFQDGDGQLFCAIKEGQFFKSGTYLYYKLEPFELQGGDGILNTVNLNRNEFVYFTDGEYVTHITLILAS